MKKTFKTIHQLSCFVGHPVGHFIVRIFNRRQNAHFINIDLFFISNFHQKKMASFQMFYSSGVLSVFYLRKFPFINYKFSENQKTLE